MRVFNGASILMPFSLKWFQGRAIAIAVAIGREWLNGWSLVCLFVAQNADSSLPRGQNPTDLKSAQTAKGTLQSALDLLYNTSFPAHATLDFQIPFLASTSRYDRRIPP